MTLTNEVPEQVLSVGIAFEISEPRIKEQYVLDQHPCQIFAAAGAAAAKSLQSCLTLCDPRDGSLPGSSFPGILQARTLEWVAISFSNA